MTNEGPAAANVTQLRRLELKGFKSLKDVVFEPGRVTVLIGANGSGKSNLFSFFRMLAAIESRELQLHVAERGGSSAILTDGMKATAELSGSLDFQIGEEWCTYRLVLVPADGDSLVLKSEYICAGRERGNPADGVEVESLPRELGMKESSLTVGGRNSTVEAKRATVADVLSHVRVYHLDDTSRSARLRARWNKEDATALKSDGAGFFSVLSRMHMNTPQEFEGLTTLVQSIYPQFGEFVFETPFENLMLQWRERGSDLVFNASQASDGFLRLVALLTLLLDPDLKGPILIDEPELGLHPAALGLVAGAVYLASERAQIILATQSVEFLRRFDPADVVVVEREGRYTTLRRPSPEVLETWLGSDFSKACDIGDLWLQNSIGGRP